MLQDILLSVGLLYAVLGLSAYYDYKRPVQLFGHYLPRSYSLGAIFVIGPFIVLGIGILFAFLGFVLLLPFFLFGMGLNWLAVLSLVIYGFFARDNSLVNINGLLIKFDFPLDIPVGLLSFWIVGIGYLIIGAFLLSPVILFIL